MNISHETFNKKWITVLLWILAGLCTVLSFSYNIAYGADEKDERAVLQIKLTDEQIGKLKEKYPGIEVQGQWVDFDTWVKFEEKENKDKKAVEKVKDKPKVLGSLAGKEAKYRIVSRKQQRAIGVSKRY